MNNLPLPIDPTATVRVPLTHYADAPLAEAAADQPHVLCRYPTKRQQMKLNALTQKYFSSDETPQQQEDALREILGIYIVEVHANQREAIGGELPVLADPIQHAADVLADVLTETEYDRLAVQLIPGLMRLSEMSKKKSAWPSGSLPEAVPQDAQPLLSVHATVQSA